MNLSEDSEVLFCNYVDKNLVYKSKWLISTKYYVEVELDLEQ